jgi:hypothetical protein
MCRPARTRANATAVAAIGLGATLVLFQGGSVRAQAPTAPNLLPPAEVLAPESDAAPTGTPEVESDNADAEGYVANDAGPALVTSGYIDVGFAKVQGDGTSFHPTDTRLPIDYATDPFATAVNSRGDVASTDSGGRFTNGFLPRSVGIGGRPSFLLNTLSFDARAQAPSSPIMAFARVHMLPRLYAQGSRADLLVEQAFGRVTPFASQELAISIGKFDSVFGVEYLENQANLRTGITPSLVSRYTTGPSIGAKAFYRRQIAALWSAVSLNVAATNSAPFIEALQPSELSLTGRPVLAGRLGYELNLPAVQVKLGGSLLRGPRNDQGSLDARQEALGLDGRVLFAGLSFTAEYLRLDQDAGPAADKLTGAGRQTLASGFHVRGRYGTLAYELPFTTSVLRKTTLYARGEERHAWFEGFTPLTVRRLTAGLRLDLWDALALKGEALLNRETEGAPDVDNDVLAASAVWTF